MRILLTGANGYIGRRLLPTLIHDGNEVVCVVRDVRRIEVEDSLTPYITFIEADFLDGENLKSIPENIDVAYYLIHSLGSSQKGFDELEKIAATNFVEVISRTHCKQIVYLSGIANAPKLSRHLNSRKEVEDILMQSGVATTVLRAAIIIGSGGASFEIIRDLAEKLPLMIAPKWLNTKCQPIAIRNVIYYLKGVMLKPAAYFQTYDIGGPDILTYKQMLLQYAKVRGLKRWIVTVPVLTPKLSSYWLHFVTATSIHIAKNLVASMSNEVIVQKKGIEKIVPQPLLNYKKAVSLAFDKIAQNEVVSSWKDAVASSKINAKLMDYIQIPTYGCFTDRKKRKLQGSPEEILSKIWRIGGDNGWYYLNFLWKTRGYMDKAIGGVGLRRGRRSADQIAPGDALDFWRVLVANKKDMRLLLFAEMKLPGEAWLEFRIKKEGDNSYFLYQTATFRPQGVWGRLYWYSVLPFHLFIFNGMIDKINSSRDNKTT